MTFRGAKTLVGGGEGFSVYTAEENGKYLVILDESTTIALLSDADAQGLDPEKIMAFSSREERRQFLAKKLRFTRLSSI